MEPFTINLHKSDIMNVVADVSVSSVHRTKDMKKGPLASHFFKHCGTDVQNALLQANDGRGLDFGQVVPTTAGQKSNNFKLLLFVCLWSWKEGTGNDMTLADSVNKCLEAASEKGYSSIVFPALGMGGLKYPPFNVAMAIMFAINNFFCVYPDTPLRTVHITLFDRNEDSVRTFLQNSIAFMTGTGMIEKDTTPRATLNGIEVFNGLESTKPNMRRRGNEPAKSSVPLIPVPNLNINQSSLISSFVSFSGQTDLLSYNVQPSFSWSNRTIGIRGEVSVGFDRFLPRFLRRSN